MTYFPSSFKIGSKTVGIDEPPLVIAEAGLAHEGSFKKAVSMLKTARGCNADFFKTQHYGGSEDGPFFTSTYDIKQRDRLEKFRLTDKELYTLKEKAEYLDIGFLVTPHDEYALDVVMQLDLPAIKIGSGEVDNFPFLKKIGQTGKPVILSTGMHCEDDIHLSIQTLKREGCRELVVMHCVTEYPTKIAGLSRIPRLHLISQGAPVGYSDHTVGNNACIAAATMGVPIIEKHFFTSHRPELRDYAGACKGAGPLYDLTEGVREAWEAVTTPLENIPFPPWARKSVHALIPIPKGTKITEQMIAVQRPGHGIPPWGINEVIGTVTVQSIPMGFPIAWEDLGIESSKV